MTYHLLNFRPRDKRETVVDERNTVCLSIILGSIYQTLFTNLLTFYLLTYNLPSLYTYYRVVKQHT